MDYSWYFIEPYTENAQTLFELLFTKDFQEDELRRQLETGIFSHEDINAAAHRFIEECHEVDVEAFNNGVFDHARFGEVVPELESSHLAAAIRILLEYGLDPNKIYTYDDGGQTSLIYWLMFVYNGYQSADAAAAMFEHGGDPSLIVEETSIIRLLNWELLFFLNDEDFRYFSDSVVHFWMVFIGYGARLEQGESSIDPVRNFDVSNLRNHRQYYYGQIHSDRSNDGMEVCFFDKDTNWEVARF